MPLISVPTAIEQRDRIQGPSRPDLEHSVRCAGGWIEVDDAAIEDLQDA